MKIYKPRGITRGQFIVVTTLGVISGVYIWRPLFDDLYPRKKKQGDSSDILLPEAVTESQTVK